MPRETIRKLTPDEVPLLRPCLDELGAYHRRVASAFGDMYPIMPIDVHLDRMREHIAEDTAVIAGLFQPDDAMVGFGMASHEAGFGEIDFLFIKETLRGGGRGGRMLKYLLAYLREKGATFVDLHVVRGNPARRFYRGHGFLPRSEILSMRL